MSTNFETLCYIVFAISFVEVKVVLFFIVRFLIKQNQPYIAEEVERNSEAMPEKIAPKDYHDLISKLRNVI